MDNPYIVVGMIVFNESKFIKHTIGAVYDHVDAFVIVDHYSTDKTVEIIKELDIDGKITIINRKWDNDYSKARNTYLDYVKKHIYPKNRRNLYYWRIDGDEVYWTSQVNKLKSIIRGHPDKAGFRCNFYSFTQDESHLDENMPTESRANIFRYTPDIRYSRGLHELPVHPATGTPLYSGPMQDAELGIHYLPGSWYCHFAWTDVQRCVTKAKNYTEHYVKDGTETKEHLNTIEANESSWWWNKKSDMTFDKPYPEIFDEIGYLPGMSKNEDAVEVPKVSVFTIVKNAIKFDYPIVEAINSVLPMADEVVVNVGIPDDDGTLGLLHKAFDGIEKVKIFESEWEGKDQGVKFLTSQTNKAKDMCKNEWCLYMQADEMYKEDQLDEILNLVNDFGYRKDIIAFRFKWLHFDGDYVSVNPHSYQEEVRLVRRDAVVSIRDAQSFAPKSDPSSNLEYREDCTIASDIHVFHYGWAKQPDKMLKKLRDFDQYYNSEEKWQEMHGNDDVNHKGGKYNYGSRDKHLLFKGEHPRHMYPRVTRFERENKDIIKDSAQWTSKLPVLSILIPTWNMSHLLKDCIAGISMTVDVPFEVIVVNNGSTDDTREYLDDQAEKVLKKNGMFLGYKAIHNPENRGFCGAVNIATLHSRAPFVSVVANDIIVPPYMYSSFITKLLEEGGIGVISPWYTEDLKLIEGDLRLVSFYNNYDRVAKEDSVLEKWHLPVCFITRRDNMELIGDWDENFITHLNDNDYEIRLRALGYRHYADKNFVCFHQPGSFGRNQLDDESGKAKLDSIYFEEKWKQKYTDKVSELADEGLLKEDVMAKAKQGNFISEEQKLNRTNWDKLK